MNRARRFFVAALCAALALPALAAPVSGPAGADLLAQIGAQVEAFAVVRSEFVQTRQMAAMKRPLVTTGRLVYAKNHGVLWQIEQPYRMTYILGEERIVEIGSDGIRRERGLRDVPGLAQVGRVFRALLGADSGALQAYFDVAASGEIAAWTLELKPRSTQVAQFLSGMQLSGGRFVEAIRVDEAGGDSTQIRLRKTQGATALGEEEMKLFAGDGASAGKR